MNLHIGNSGISVSNSDIFLGLMIFIIIALVIAVLSRILYMIIRNSDNKKTIEKCHAMIVEKISSENPKSNIAWYVVQKENGERLKLRNFNANNLIIAKDDIGIITYQGKTIINFVRQS